MANELKQVTASGKTIYRVFVDRATGNVFRTDTHVLEPAVAANLAHYAVALVATVLPTVYYASAPVGLPAGTYWVVDYIQAGGSPATTDLPLGAGQFFWDGSQEVTLDQWIIQALFALRYGVRPNVGTPTNADILNGVGGTPAYTVTPQFNAANELIGFQAID